jgi:hypothetical protein
MLSLGKSDCFRIEESAIHRERQKKSPSKSPSIVSASFVGCPTRLWSSLDTSTIAVLFNTLEVETSLLLELMAKEGMERSGKPARDNLMR